MYGLKMISFFFFFNASWVYRIRFLNILQSVVQTHPLCNLIQPGLLSSRDVQYFIWLSAPHPVSLDRSLQGLNTAYAHAIGSPLETWLYVLKQSGLATQSKITLKMLIYSMIKYLQWGSWNSTTSKKVWRSSEHVSAEKLRNIISAFQPHFQPVTFIHLLVVLVWQTANFPTVGYEYQTEKHSYFFNINWKKTVLYSVLFERREASKVGRMRGFLDEWKAYCDKKKKKKKTPPTLWALKCEPVMSGIAEGHTQRDTQIVGEEMPTKESGKSKIKLGFWQKCGDWTSVKCIS